MDLTKIRSDFTIFVVDDEESIREVLKEALTAGGYQVETFPTAEVALERLKEAPPHLIFSDIRMPGMNGIQFLAKVKELSRDIEFIIMTSHASIETAVEAIKLGAYDYIFKPFDNLSDVLVTADRTIERIYLKLENEQLLEELAEKNKLLGAANKRITAENQEMQLLNGFMQKLAQTMDPDETINILLNEISFSMEAKPVLFFRYLPAYQSLIVGNASKLPLEKVKNLGVKLNNFDPRKLPEVLSQPSRIPQIQEIMKEAFGSNGFEALPFLHQNSVYGIIVTFGTFSGDSNRRLIDSFIQIARVSFDNATMAKKIHEMAIKDPLTGLYNRRFFNERLEEELVRSRRTHYPLALIYLDIDHFKKYNDTNGHPMGDVILKSVAQILQRTSRKSDIVARLGGEEFAILCPHTGLEGAAIKAEKVRMAVESTKFPHGEKQPMGKVTISLGVSEYPTIVADSQTLVRSADDALYQVKQGGRNRVCMAKAPNHFKPEFTPLAVPVVDTVGRGGAAQAK